LKPSPSPLKKAQSEEQEQQEEGIELGSESKDFDFKEEEKEEDSEKSRSDSDISNSNNDHFATIPNISFTLSPLKRKNHREEQMQMVKMWRLLATRRSWKSSFNPNSTPVRGSLPLRVDGDIYQEGMDNENFEVDQLNNCGVGDDGEDLWWDGGDLPKLGNIKIQIRYN
jgi:hypothetical protein